MGKINLPKRIDLKHFKPLPKNTPASFGIYPRKSIQEKVMVLLNVKEENVDGTRSLGYAESTSSEESPITGLVGYMGRMSLDEGNYIVVPDEIYEQTLELNEYLRDIGISSLMEKRVGISSIPDGNVIPVTMSEEQKLPESVLTHLSENTNRRIFEALLKDVKRISPFIFSKNIHNLNLRIRDITGLRSFEIGGNHLAAEILNHKGHALEHLQNKRILVPEGKTVHSREEALHEFKRLKQSGSKRIGIKLPRSASGNGIYVVENEEEFEEVLNNKIINYHINNSRSIEYMGRPYDLLGVRIEKWLEYDNKKVVSSPGVVIKVGNDPHSDYIISATDQILQNNIHIGNVWPMEYWTKDMEKALVEVANWSRRLGYTDILGVDFIVIQNGKDKQDIEIYVSEVNGRITGQTHGAILVHNLFGSSINPEVSWAIDNNVKVQKGTSLNDYSSDIEGKRIAFTGEDGIILNNQATIPLGEKIQITVVDQNKGRPVLDAKKSIEDKRGLAMAG